MQNLLEVRELSVNFYLPEATTMAVRNVSFSISRGRTLGLVGESGCGKSVTALSLLRLINKPGRIVSGEILFNNKNITALPEQDLISVRGREISMIFQEPMTSLNPVFKIGFQIAEPIKLHLGKNESESREMVYELLDRVGIPNPEDRYNSYPHELSGGMRQRIMIAMALSTSPLLLLADEPTTALDVTIQAQILDLLIDIQEAHNMSLLLISHDLGIVANVADDVAIMYAGEIMETGPVNRIYESPKHPYTIGLFESIPKIGENKDKLHTIPGSVPVITEEPTGCVYYSRCSKHAPECQAQKIALEDKGDNQLVRCIRA